MQSLPLANGRQRQNCSGPSELAASPPFSFAKMPYLIIWHKESASLTVARGPASNLEHTVILISAEYNYWYHFELL